jgi:hypothetical protein
MSYLVFLVVDNPDYCEDILEGWEAAGVTGVTILESSGLGRLRRHGMREDLSILPSLQDLLAMDEVHHRTLLSVVANHWRPRTGAHWIFICSPGARSAWLRKAPRRPFQGVAR